jgi:hypothetical protein
VAVQEELRVVEDPLEVDEGRATVRAPHGREMEVLAVPGGVAREVAMVEVLRVLCEVAELADEVVRRVHHGPVGVDGVGRVGRGEPVVGAEARVRGGRAPAAAHEGRLGTRGRGVARDVHARVALVAGPPVLDREALPHEAVRVVGACDAAVLQAKTVRRALHALAY